MLRVFHGVSFSLSQPPIRYTRPLTPLGSCGFSGGFYFQIRDWHHGWMKGLFIFPILLILLFGTPANSQS